MNDRLLKVYEIECCGKGNAFLTDGGLLITVKHVVKANQPGLCSHQYPIMLNPGDSGEKIECKILGHDEDAFEKSTLVLLEPQRELPEPTRVVTESVVNPPEMLIKGYLSGIGVPFEVKSSKKENCRNDDNEIANMLISVEGQLPKSVAGMSGSPVARGATIYGVLVDQLVDCGGNAFRLWCLCDEDFWTQVEKLRKRLREKREFEQKAAQPIPTFAEYVAEACHNCPPKFLSLLQDPSEYTNKYPGKDISACQSKLLDILESMLRVDASNDASDDSIDAEIKEVYKKLEDLYNDHAHRMNVYISVLGYCVDTADNGEGGQKSIRDVICLLDHARTTADLSDFSYRHLFLAECYIAIGKKTEAVEELEKAKCLAWDEEKRSFFWEELYSQWSCCQESKGITDKRRFLENAKNRCPDAKKAYGAYTECLRSLARLEIKQAEFVDAVENIKEAYEIDRNKEGAEEYIEEDNKHFKYICYKALDYYSGKGVEAYGDWYRFYTRASKSDMYSVIADLYPKGILIKWASAMYNWNDNRQPLGGVDALKYIHIDGSSVDTDNLEQEVNSAKNKKLILIVRDIQADNSDLFKDLQDKFRTLLCDKLSICLELVRPPEELKDIYLYIDKYQPNDNEANRPPVWVLICRK